jgi:cell shape-determining protein MreC
LTGVVPVFWKFSTRNSVSVLVRPEIAVFRELDTLVRNLSDQLAGFRRRALAAEARSRELEQILAGMTGKLDEVRQQAEDTQQSRDAALVQARTLEAQLSVARGEVQRVQAAFAEVSAKATPEAMDQELAKENERLRARLQDAREKATQLTERVRFLRQQVGQGAER